MLCPKCQSNLVRSKGRKLMQHPALGSSIRRNLVCDSCNYKFQTVEILQAVADVLVVDHLGQLSELKKRLLEGIAQITAIESRRAVGSAAAEDPSYGR